MNYILITSISDQLVERLTKLKEEISAYTSEEAVWRIGGEIKNSAGNLCLHLCGNLQTYIGAILGQTGYIRNRDAEFSTKGVLKETLIKEIETTIDVVQQTLASIKPSKIEQNYPQDVLGKPMTTGYFLIHLVGHLNYHLGQVNYHRRLLDK